ncbi:PcfJ domain-containing protein [Candidatus Formimonas warabiya]|uniref:PcfJ-like protein n=1 Tax=Formimonas warabiya TaxID=1761012 RepID=A0A3G1KNT3_FORW1|nr:PcfJ domain-containing protein [Candidatus Formimonas warabiya]ATW24141.1 hypothetical protein DCMF_04510 [Candidatus Formimonas warabiya]
MLIKKELEQIPVQAFPVLPVKGKRDKYAAAVQVISMEKCGNILVIDVFRREGQFLAMRFFSDGNTFLVSNERPGKGWEKRMPSAVLEGVCSYGWDIDAAAADIQLANSVLKNKQVSWHYVRGIRGEMDAFVGGINEKKREQSMERKYGKMKEHFAMFPDYPADLPEFCETQVFKNTVVFLDKVQKTTRKAVCGHCGHKYSVAKEIKPGQSGSCPKCKMPAKYRASWAKGLYREKAKICITHKVNNQLLVRWANVERIFPKQKYQYSFWDFYRNLHLWEQRKPVLYAYDYKPIMQWGENWYRQKNGSTHQNPAYIYTNNLREVFGESYYHVDLQAGLQNTGQLPFSRLLDNLENIPAAEYLFKMGLTALAAAYMGEEKLGQKAGFAEVLGVSKQYLPMYQKFNIEPLEHKIIRASRTWVSEKNFLKFRALAPDPWDYGYIAGYLEKMSFERFANYFTKQKELNGKQNLHYSLMLYRDYLDMSDALKVDMSHKSVRFPSNIQAAHDQILPRFNQMKHKVEDEKFKLAVEKLYSGMKDYAKGDYCIVFPALRSDLITEGQSLKHCVGGQRYADNHMAGTQMIFFVRRAQEPGKPFFTMEIDMKELKILQLHGYNHRAAPPDVKKFAQEFLRTLPRREINRVRVTIPA